MATTLDELINNPVLLNNISVTEFGSVYKQMDEKSFAERTQDDIALSEMLESKKKDLINSSASRLSEMSKEDLASLRALIGDAVQISGVEVDLASLKGNIDKAIEDINAYENSNQSLIDGVNREPVDPKNWQNFVMFNELSSNAKEASEQLVGADNLSLQRMLSHCSPEIVGVGAGIQSADVRALVYNEVNRRLGYAAENMDSLSKNDIKWMSEMVADEHVGKNASNMMKFATAYEEKMSELSNVEPEHVVETIEESVVEESQPIEIEAPEVLRDRRKQEFLDALAAYEASDYEDASLHEKAGRLVELMGEEEINNLKADLEASGNEDALTYLQGILDEVVIEDEPEQVVEAENSVEPVVEQEPVAEEESVVEVSSDNADESTTDSEEEAPTGDDNVAETEETFNKEAYLQELGKQDLAQLLVTVKAVKKLENNEEQLKATEEFVVQKAKEVNDNKQLMLNPQKWYQWRDLLNEFNDEKEQTNPEITKALSKVNTDINSFEEEYGIDAKSLQSPEQVKINQEQIAKLSEINFFDTIDKPINKPWTDKEVEDWKKGAITPTLQGFSGALRNPNLSKDDKAKILEKAKASLVQLDRVYEEPKAYGDISLVVAELKKAYPDDVSVIEADKYLARFVEKRGGTYLYPEMEGVSKKLDQLKVKGDLTLLGRKDINQDTPDSEIAKLKELTRIETETYLANITPAGTQITPQMFAQEYEARLNKAILNVVQADCTAKGKNQAEIAKTLNDLDSGKPVNINQDSFIGYYVAKGAKGTAAANILGKNPSFNEVAQGIKNKLNAFDEKCTKKYGEKYTVAKNILKSFAWGAAFGVAAKVGAVAMTAVAVASFANQAHNIYKDFKKQKAIAVAQGQKFSFWKNYALENKLRMGGAFLSASTVAISGLGAVGVAVGPIIMSIKAGAGFSLMMGGAQEQAAKARAATIEHNKKNPNNKKSVFWAGLKAYGISALSFGAGYLGGQAAGTAYENAVHTDTPQPAIDTNTPTAEQTSVNSQTTTLEQTTVNAQTPVAEQPTVGTSTPTTEQTTVNAQTPVAEQPTVGNSTPTTEQTTVNAQTPTAEQPTVGTSTPTTEQTVVNNQTPTAEQTGTENQSTYKPFEQWKPDWLNDSENTQQPEEYRPAPLLPEDMTYDDNGNLIKIPEGMTLDENGKIVPEVQQPEVSAQDTQFWNNRANQFLGEETTNNLYSRIDSGEIKLPEGIESKEEFAYKLAMAMEQSPAYVADALGVEFQNTAQFESQIQSMTPEQFAKLGDLMNDYSDRGNYIGDNPFETTNTNTSENSTVVNNTPSNDNPLNDGSNANPQVNNETPEQTIVTEPVKNVEPQEFVYPEKPSVTPIIEQTPAVNNFEVTVMEEGRFSINGQSSNYQVFNDAARELVGNNDNAVKDVSLLMQQAAIIHDVEQQIAEGATFNEQQMAYIEQYKQMHADHLAEYADKYNIDANDIKEGALNVKESFESTQEVVQPVKNVLGQTTDLTTVYETDIDGNPLDPKIQQQMLNTANEYAAPLNALVENGQATHEHFEKQGISTDYYKVGDETYHIQRDTGNHCDGSISIIHTDKDGVMTTLSLDADGKSTSYVERPNEDRIVVHKDENGNIVNDNPAPLKEGQMFMEQAPVAGIDIVQPSVDDQWLPEDGLYGFVTTLHNLSSEIRENNAMIDTSNLADNPKIQYEVYETDVLGNKLDPQIQQDIIDTAHTYGRRLDAMVEHGYGTHEHFEERGWSTDRYHIGNDTFEISRDTGADADGRLNITHTDANGVKTFHRLEADGTSMTQVDRPNEPSVITHRDASGNVIDDTNSAPAQEGQQQAPATPQQEQEQDTPRLNLKDEYLKDVKDLGLENPRSLSLHATEQRTSVNGEVSGYSSYSRFDRCDNGYAATNHDGALGLVFDDKGNGTFKISENDTVRPMTFEEAQGFVKAITLIDSRNADGVKLAEALYTNNHEAYALNEAKLNGLSGDITALAVGDGMVAFSDNGVSVTLDGRSYHAVLDESGKIVETSSMMGNKYDGISSESMRETLQAVAEKNPESSIAKAYAALGTEQQGAENNGQVNNVENQNAEKTVVENPQNLDLSTVRNQENLSLHNGVGSNTISLTDNNGNLIFNETYDVRSLPVDDLMPDVHILNNGMIQVGPKQYFSTQDYSSLAGQEISTVLCEDKLYQDIAAKENPTPGEQQFMKLHEEKLGKWGITRTEDGEFVRDETLGKNYKAGNGVVYECNKGGVEILKDGKLPEIHAQDKVYQDLLERKNDGSINALEQRFIREHEANLREQHMYHDPKGNLVQLPEGVNVTKDGAAYRISSNIVAENNAYGLNQQDYLSDAKELLGRDGTAKDQIAVKSFLMNDDIASDLKARMAAGEQFSASESKAINAFMANHEAQEQNISDKYGIVRGNDGEMHKAENPTKTNSPTKVMIGRNR